MFRLFPYKKFFSLIGKAFLLVIFFVLTVYHSSFGIKSLVVFDFFLLKRFEAFIDLKYFFVVEKQFFGSLDEELVCVVDITIYGYE